MFISTVSASKIKAYDSCKQQYKFRYIDKLRDSYNPNTNTDALQFGSYVHRIFELGVSSTSEDELNEIAKAERENYKFPDAKLKILPKMITNFAKLNQKLTETVSAEQNFKMDVTESYSINGYIDRIVKGKTGGYLIIDYKTSKRKTPKRDLFSDPQMILYAYAVHKLYNVAISDISVAHYYPHLDELVTVKFTDIHIKLFLKTLTDKIWEIRKKKKNDFYPCLNQFCDWCNYKELCPEFGGTKQLLDEAITSEKKRFSV
jgi:putative RecB family exonuclease|tara:strand:+ start:648 stop:1427 length:780 start_codon:yes stop_codon:yes gene_type:complete